ncbi:ATP-binding protein [Deinococcus enclensis]|uniref:Cdc6-like AAA superfamily ATPase n=1 Tax=Deinococcus enclensis TaxID=1049582 RepID=A0ABT9MD01_9DEIO|nr:ATP-binding protein [Deinococcus enclensis]MDP9764488.1 Cdc6-like AAA superfamily ATPase [Deinococcus enclensis]
MVDAHKLDLLEKVFTPAAPLEDQALFAGRIEQLAELMLLTRQKGMHGILYGERGVGKTSLVNIFKIITEASFDKNSVIVAKLSCYSEDNFEEVWQKVFQEIKVPNRLFAGEERGDRPAARLDGTTRLSAVIKDDFVYTSKNIVRTLSNLKTEKLVIIFDEFDRLEERFDKKLFADVIKNVSDSHGHIKFIIVGVSEDVTNLIGEHTSIRRNLKEVHIPLMRNVELKEIISKGMDKLQLDIDPEAEASIVTLSGGYPYYTHMLAYYACYTAISNKKPRIEMGDVHWAAQKAIADSKEVIRQAFQLATLANQRNNYKEVLYACALCNTDEHNYFQASDLERIMTVIMERPFKVPQYARHLSNLSTLERGSILVCIGENRKKRYKFRDPLMRTYIRLLAFQAGIKI